MVPQTHNNPDPSRRHRPPIAATTDGLTLFFADPARIEAERRRLIAFSMRAAGGIDGVAAEEIAQEALTLAWQNRANLRDAAAWQPWLTGITRNLCLRRQRSIAINSKRSVDWAAAESSLANDSAATPPPDPYAELERVEREGLLDQALSRLPRATHSLLIDRYVRDLPIAEIAAERGVREETAAVQLFRSRAALKKSLTAPEMREQALALGILPVEEAQRADWHETRLWCPTCGSRRLMGIFGLTRMTNRITGKPYIGFVLRCCVCHAEEDQHSGLCNYFFHEGEPAGKVLEGVKGYRAGYRRMANWWNDYAEAASRTGTITCSFCRRPTPVQHRIPPEDDWHAMGMMSDLIYACCRHCGRRSYITADERSFVHPAAQRFWSDNPRTRTLPIRSILVNGRKALLTRLESVTGSATLDIVCDTGTLEVTGTYPGGVS